MIGFISTKLLSIKVPIKGFTLTHLSPLRKQVASQTVLKAKRAKYLLQEVNSWNDAEIRGMITVRVAILKFTSKSGEKGFQSADAAGAK